MSFVLSLVALGLSVRALCATLLLSQPTHALYWLETTTIKPPPISCLDTFDPYVTMCLILLSLIVLLLALTIFWKLRQSIRKKGLKNKTHTKLGITIYNEFEFLSIPLKLIPYQVSDLLVSSLQDCVKPLLTTQGIRPVLRFDWKFLSISLRDSNRTIKLPEVIFINV